MTTTPPPALTLESGLTLATALGSGLAAGVFFAFSGFVMQGLDRLPPAQAVAAMQSINVTAVRPAFMTLLFGTALACVPVMVIAVRHNDERPAAPVLIGGALYLVGVIGLTIGYHVPLNDALAEVDPGGVDVAARWDDYVVGWTRWNHLRAASGLGAAAAFTWSLLRS